MALVAFLAAGAGYFVARSMDAGNTSGAAPARSPAVEDLLGKKRPDFSHQSIDGKTVSASDFNGSVWLINFWATWCKPCVEEMPMLSELQSEQAGTRLQVVGIALDDADRARQFASELEVSYPILVGQADVVLTGRRYGNSTGLLPFSVLIDADGIIRWSQLGALDKQALLHQVRLLE